MNERNLIKLVAWDRVDIPISSLSGKLKRGKPKVARELGLREGDTFEGDRSYARFETEDVNKAKGTKLGMARFAEEFPRYGKILQGYIEEQRAVSEEHVYFGMLPGKRLTGDDYSGVLTGLGFTQGQAENFHPALIDASRKISRARDEERRIMVGSKTF
jgi:hypothetical protein